MDVFIDSDSTISSSVESDDDFGYDDENAVPVAKTVNNARKQAPKAKQPSVNSGSKIFTDKSNSANVNQVFNNTTEKSTKTVEEIYQKKTQLEHILLRPDTYSE